MLSAANVHHWSLLAIAAGVAATGAVDFFSYPLDAELFFLGWAIALGAWLLALAVVAACTVLTYRHRGDGDAVLLGLLAFIGLATVVHVDLDTGYPRVYHATHRADFAAAAARGETVRWMSNGSGYGYGYAHLPTARRGQELTIDGTTVTAEASLGGGWWWVAD